jgi:hypothetical protein
MNFKNQLKIYNILTIFLILQKLNPKHVLEKNLYNLSYNYHYKIKIK